jgi:hypothetical protein
VAPLPAEVRDGLGATADHAPAVRRQCEQTKRALVATRRGGFPPHDDGVEVRRICHPLRSQASEPFHGVFKNRVEWRTPMPVNGLRRSQLWALGAMVVSQVVVLSQHEHHLPLGKGMKPLLRAA